MTAIWKRELVSFFKNPIGYFVFMIYAFLSAIVFCLFVIWQNTSYLGNYFGMWLFVVDIVVIAVMSMRFFSEERKNKTDQLLLTSPLSLYSLVIGKFLGAYTIILSCTALNLIYVVIVDAFGTMDYGALLSNTVGTLLILSAMISISLFISALTENQIAAAAGSFAVLFLLMIVDYLAMFMPTWLAKAMMSLNIYSQYEDFTNGIISLPPVIYYISVTVISLFLTVKVIEKRRWN
ncbi:MAG: ABC transporter permease subunit [Clostridia bacterium]|nr:ABC transporter permease subunit [Clostridia bacterium]MBQ9922764.1 ABC transporter permease subunit [Clostridia bacterium]